jgi:hypothetical protein
LHNRKIDQARGRGARCHAAPRQLFERGRTMGFGRGILLWLLGVPIPIIILIALFWH